jgi:hypothetical protein
MDALDDFRENLNNLPNNIANDVWPNGWDRWCKFCGKTIHMTPQDCGYALSYGWPKCCGHEMGDVEKE